jgi:hypothetical protein
MSDNPRSAVGARPGVSRDGAALRYEQTMVDADIEGAPRSPEIEAMIDLWDREGVDDAEQIRRLTAYFRSLAREVDAAE